MTGSFFAAMLGGIKLAIKQDVCLGERRFLVTMIDAYGYRIDFYFNLVASSNPVYATGILEFVEGSTFDIGAQYDLVRPTQYVMQGSRYTYY